MLCKKCGKEFDSENKVCPFCNEDNNVSESPSVPAAQPAPEEPKVEPVVQETPVAETPAPVSSPATPTTDVEVLIEEPAKEEATPATEVLLEPAAAPATETVIPAAEITPTAEVEATPAATEAAAPAPTEGEAVPTEVTPAPATEDTPTAEAKTEAEATPAATETAPTTTEGESAPVEEEKKKKIEPKTIILFVVILVLIVVVVFMYLPKDEETPAPTPNNNNNTETNNNNNNNNNNNGGVVVTPSNDANTLLSYSGVYSNGTYQVTISTSSTSSSTMTIAPIVSDGTSADVTLVVENGVLVNDEDPFSDFEENVKVEVTAEGLTITASSTDTTSLLNKVSGTYTKQVTTTKNWTGYYKNDKFEVIIDETSGTKATVNITGTADDGTMIIYGTYFSDYTETQLYEKDEFFGDTTEINITKTTDGITITASSTDPDGTANKINGTYKKVN